MFAYVHVCILFGIAFKIFLDRARTLAKEVFEAQFRPQKTSKMMGVPMCICKPNGREMEAETPEESFRLAGHQCS